MFFIGVSDFLVYFPHCIMNNKLVVSYLCTCPLSPYVFLLPTNKFRTIKLGMKHTTRGHNTFVFFNFPIAVKPA